jgi:hypothetical protein
MNKSWLLVVALGGCGGDDGGGMTTPDAQTNAFQTLITSSWSLQPGTEIYQCATVTLTREMFISELRPTIPTGTHHTVVSIGVPTKPDSAGYMCSDPFEFGGSFIYGTGVGSIPFVYPDGVALHLQAGQQVHVNLHLYNTSDSVLTGTSGIDFKEVPGATVQHQARVELNGQNTLNILPGISTQTGSCTITATEVNVVSFQPHMHQLGTHLKYTVTPSAGSPNVIYDRDYTFDGQEHIMIDPPLALHANDQVRIDCTYNNTTANTVTFGESSNDEMCLAGMTIYPSTARFCN